MNPKFQQAGHYYFQWDSVSDLGKVRENNEDSLIQAPEFGLLGVCDGLGGHAAGEVASAIASSTMVEQIAEGGNSPGEVLSQAVRRANTRILDEQAANPSLRGMGTTLSALWIVPNDSSEIWVAHIGDSRIYLLRDGEMSQVTDDHSPVFRLHKQGILTKDQILEHPQKNLLDRSLGIMVTLQPDIFPTELQDGDIVLICTDGLTDALRDREIQGILTSTPFDEACSRLVQAANQRGGYDNVTLAILEIIRRDKRANDEPESA